MTFTVIDALRDAIADPEQHSPGFTYSVERASEGCVRVRWIGGTRNGVEVPDGDVTTALDHAYDRLIAVLRDGGFLPGR